MASGESQKHLLSLIRNFASEKSQEELRVSDLKKRLLELENDLNVANADLDGAKRSREMAEQELRGSQARISLLQEEILKLRSDLDALKVRIALMLSTHIVRFSFIIVILCFRTLTLLFDLLNPTGVGEQSEVGFMR
ncbi:hypothetical protein GW17_00050576 [Ensete ventricosum]|uniref:Uncharacterized protein n=1 Tax=Ensete ventricosum TaxID=4639 RepID=A0A444CNJ0_ENSVE|nr:hypothetical protein GW17_00050576 [Ensete ventricosum]RZR72570.1 hypothetical protein BHM03_00014732 [Ensete ventricosum]